METLLRPPEVNAIDHELSLLDDTTTWLAEVLPGSMKNKFDYTFDGRDLYGRDGRAMTPIFEKAIVDAENTARYNPALNFEVRRRKIEDGERADMISMARGEGPNTMVVVSDFVPELYDAKADVGGYNVRRRQTMLRVISRNQDGTLSMYSQSLDGSHRQALESIYGFLGFSAQPGELLGQRIKLDMDEVQQELLIDTLRSVYDESLSKKLGGEWYAGRPGTEASQVTDTYKFVCSEHILLQAFTERVKECGGSVSDNLMYDLAAEMRRRYEMPDATREINQALSGILDTKQARELMSQSGQAAKSEGMTFSGCGMSLSASNNSTGGELQALGLGNKICVEIRNGQIVKCPCCKLKVKAIVPDKESIFCSNKKCKLAHPRIKRKK